MKKNNCIGIIILNLIFILSTFTSSYASDLKVLYESQILSGTSNAVYFEDNIAVLFTEDQGHAEGYPEKHTNFSNLKLLIGNKVIDVDKSKKVAKANCSSLALDANDNLGIAYTVWAGNSYAFDSPYKIYLNSLLRNSYSKEQTGVILPLLILTLKTMQV